MEERVALPGRDRGRAAERRSQGIGNLGAAIDEHSAPSRLGEHAHGKLNFTYFCEAQMVWDTAMAVYSLNYLEKNPNAVVVILTGVGHAQKGAVPRQIHIRSKVPYAVILPEVSGGIDRETISANEADYLMLELH